jgi:hypothetical protein
MARRRDTGIPPLPASAELLARRLKRLRTARRDVHASGRHTRRRRVALDPKARAAVLAKTASRCHVCGGMIEGSWQADHVLAHSSGGLDGPANYLPAHATCNNYRWDYSPEEFQWVLKIGVWARTQIETESELGARMLQSFHRYDSRRQRRRRKR